MGNERHIRQQGGFTHQLYETASVRVTINGVTGHMVKKKSDKTGTHDGLPSCSGSCDIYFRKGEDGYASQAKVYENRKMILDFDWSHNHKNKGDGRRFAKGVVHVQRYVYDKKGHITRTEARYMNNAEIAKYGSILRYFNPNVKFRP